MKPRHDGYALPSEFTATVSRWPRRRSCSGCATWRGPAWERPLLAGRSALWGVEARLVRVEPRRFDVTCGYRDPGQLGVDRWLALVAARAFHSGAVCVVDCGTAITVDALSAERLSTYRRRDFSGYSLDAPQPGRRRQAICPQWKVLGDDAPSRAFHSGMHSLNGTLLAAVGKRDQWSACPGGGAVRRGGSVPT